MSPAGLPEDIYSGTGLHDPGLSYDPDRAREDETTRPVPYRMRQEVEEEVQAMLALGVIEPSRSEWRSPVVLVPKPDGTRRFCIDFRQVNAISCFDAYPMPRVDELLGHLGEAQFITTLDLSKGYWQIPLDEGSKEKTAFATP